MNHAPPTTANAHVRFARPTAQLAKLVDFYTAALGFKVLGEFRDHAGFDGVMLGHANSGYHLEFTTEKGQPAPSWQPTTEHLMVFYFPDQDEWQAIVGHLDALGIQPVPSHNPYWDQNGSTFEDPDGYRFVIQHQAWPT